MPELPRVRLSAASQTLYIDKAINEEEATIDEELNCPTVLPLWSCQLIFFKLTHLFGNIKEMSSIWLCGER